MNIKSLIPLALKVPIHRFYKKHIIERFYPEKIIDEIYVSNFGRHINLNNPHNINEKINWLKLHSDLNLWARLADKYLVREYVKSKGLEYLLPKLYGVYNSSAEIEFDKLPNSFVIKVNHGSGDCMIVKDKHAINFAEVKAKFQTLIKSKFDAKLYEPHYSRIKPKIIIEELLGPNNQKGESPSLVDYKVWCFNGKPYSIMTIQNRMKTSIDIAVYDLEWKPVEYAIFEDSHHHRSNSPLPRPSKLDEMLRAASKLSAELPVARVDFYYIDNKIYFGEITLTSAGGFMRYYTDRYLDELGERIDLNI